MVLRFPGAWFLLQGSRLLVRLHPSWKAARDSVRAQGRRVLRLNIRTPLLHRAGSVTLLRQYTLCLRGIRRLFIHVSGSVCVGVRVTVCD